MIKMGGVEVKKALCSKGSNVHISPFHFKPTQKV